MGTTLFTGVAVWFNSQTALAQIESNPHTSLVVEAKNYDWGQININDGKVSTSFALANSGSEPLKLYDITTSCACTTAQSIIGDTASPIFGMHSKSSYITEIPAGETSQIKVIFDPAFHGPSGIGSISRQITMATNDPTNPTLTLNVTATVTN